MLACMHRSEAEKKDPARARPSLAGESFASLPIVNDAAHLVSSRLIRIGKQMFSEVAFGEGILLIIRSVFCLSVSEAHIHSHSPAPLNGTILFGPNSSRAQLSDVLLIPARRGLARARVPDCSFGS